MNNNLSQFDGNYIQLIDVNSHLIAITSVPFLLELTTCRSVKMSGKTEKAVKADCRVYWFAGLR